MEQAAKQIGIWVFSGTGNTQKCAEALQNVLIERGVSADLHQIEGRSARASQDL